MPSCSWPPAVGLWSRCPAELCWRFRSPKQKYSDSWAVTAWSKNLNDEKYNSEWSPGPQFFPSPGYSNNFVFKGQPMTWGVDVEYRF